MIPNKKTKLIVTSGPTREFIDPIRFLSNPSTGRMGYHIAKAGINQGYQVTYICGPVPKRFSVIEGARNSSVVSTSEMLEQVLEEITGDSVLVMAAAPADYRPEQTADHKIKKTEMPSIKLIPNPDILRTVKDHVVEKGFEKVILAGFAAETRNIEEYARSKLNKKNLDLIFLNDLTKSNSGFGVETNELTVFRKDGSYEKWVPETKERLGYKIIEEIEQWLQ